jgi:RNA polymerase sigma-70 factor (ECF subfamily)
MSPHAADCADAFCTDNVQDLPANHTTFERLFHSYAVRVYNLARRMLASDADAEDVTQEVFLQVVRKLGTFRGEAAVTTWLHRVTVNAALLHRRRAARRPERPTTQDVQGEVRGSAGHTPRHLLPANPHEVALDRECCRVIEQAIAVLPPLYRDVYILADVEDCSNAQIARLLKLSLAAVKSRLYRARSSMRIALAPYFEDARA